MTEQQNFQEPTDEEIALCAYRIWLQEGCPHGRDREHWQKARDQLLSHGARGKSSPDQSFLKNYRQNGED